LSSLDGRIALEDKNTGKTYLPKTLTTADDFRLFLELHAQADCLITHGGYLRSLANGTLGNILQSGVTPETADIAEWRIQQGLVSQPSIVIASGSLDFPMPASIKQHNQRCYIATGQCADPARIKAWEKKGYTVIIAGRDRDVEGRPLVTALSELGFQRMYLIAGPQILETMLRDRQLSRMYQTITHQLLGGEAFRTLLPGPELGESGHLKLNTLYYDPLSANGSGQWFAQFEPEF